MKWYKKFKRFTVWYFRTLFNNPLRILQAGLFDEMESNAKV